MVYNWGWMGCQRKQDLLYRATPSAAPLSYLAGAASAASSGLRVRPWGGTITPHGQVTSPLRQPACFLGLDSGYVVILRHRLLPNPPG